MEVGDYYHYLEKQKAEIGKYDDGANFINFMGIPGIALYEMTFNKNYFFSEDYGLIFKIDINQSMPVKKFDIIYHTGLSFRYVKSENPI